MKKLIIILLFLTGCSVFEKPDPCLWTQIGISVPYSILLFNACSGEVKEVKLIELYNFHRKIYEESRTFGMPKPNI